jgi:hypothetical protein
MWRYIHTWFHLIPFVNTNLVVRHTSSVPLAPTILYKMQVTWVRTSLMSNWYEHNFEEVVYINNIQWEMYSLYMSIADACTAKFIRVLVTEVLLIIRSWRVVIVRQFWPELIQNVWACDASGIRPFQPIEKLVGVCYAFLLINISSLLGRKVGQ